MIWAMTAVLTSQENIPWVPTRDDPRKFAAAIDQAVHGMRGMAGQSGLRATNPMMKLGSCRCDIAIVDDRKFHLEYALFGPGGSSLTRETVMANGGKYATSSAAGTSKPNSTTSRRLVKSTILTDWSLDATRLILASIGTSERPVSALVAAAAAAGLTTRVDKRDFTDGGKSSHERRLCIERPASSAKKLGELRYEIWIAESGLPVFVGASVTTPDRKKTRLACQYRWGKSQSFSPNAFALPVPSSGAKG